MKLYIVGLLLVAGLLAFVLNPGNPELQPVFAAEITATTGPEVTVRIVETRTTPYNDKPVPIANETMVERTEPVVNEATVDEDTTEFFFQQPGNATDDGPRLINLTMTGNETYRIEPQADTGNGAYPIEPTGRVLLATLLN